jgi:hypothetical protein
MFSYAYRRERSLLCPDLRTDLTLTLLLECRSLTKLTCRTVIRESRFEREMREIRCELMPAQVSAAAVSGLLAGGDDLDLDKRLGPHRNGS